MRIYASFLPTQPHILWNIKKGILLSTKREYKAPGYGMRNIQAVVDKYDGDFKITSDGNLVKVEAVV